MSSSPPGVSTSSSSISSTIRRRDPAILAWANGLLQTHSSHRAIVVTHYIASPDPASFSTQGQAIYDALKGNPNLFLMLGGHLDTAGRRQDIFNGNTVHTLVSDFQTRANGGNGWLRVMEFSPASNTIHVMTYSPSLNQWKPVPPMISLWRMTWGVRDSG